MITRRTTAIKFNKTLGTIEVLPRKGEFFALTELALADLGFKRSINEDGMLVLASKYSEELMAEVRKLFCSESLAADKPLQPKAEEPKRWTVIYPLSAAQESAGTRKPTAEELEELEELDELADEVEDDLVLNIKARVEVKSKNLKSAEDILALLQTLR